MYKPYDLERESGFRMVEKYYEENKEKPWKEWLEVGELFPRSGKQGLLGTFEMKDGNSSCIFKMSQYINYLIQHEISIMMGLNRLSGFCPHFCKGIGAIIADVNPKIRKEGNPFHIKEESVEKEILLMENLHKTTKFYNYIRSPKITDSLIYSVIKQTLFAITIAQRKEKFTHYDLHSNNIMMKKCNKNLVFLYILNDQNQYVVPTMGCYPVIIDFGFSYSKSLEGKPLWPSMGHTDAGFTSCAFDPIADPKLFFVTVAGEVYEKRRKKKNKKLVNISRNLFSPLRIDWDSGWDTRDRRSAADYVLKMLRPYNTISRLFKDYDHYCIDIIQTLITLPFQNRKYNNIQVAYKTFLSQFAIIEREIGNEFYCLYFLKDIVDVARELKSYYINKETRKTAIETFRAMLCERVDKITQFCTLRKLHFEKLFCSLLTLTRNIEGIYYDFMFSKKQEKERDYSKLPIKDLEQMFAIMEVNFPHSYTYNSDTIIMTFDIEKENCSLLTLSQDEIEEINNTNTLCQGTYLYSILKKRKNLENRSDLEILDDIVEHGDESDIESLQSEFLNSPDENSVEDFMKDFTKDFS